jgi:hypothetical protein
MAEAITRHRISTTTTDAGGNTVADEWDIQPIGLGLFAPTPTADVTGDGRDGTQVLPSVYFEGWHPDIVATDRIAVRGALYDIVGEPQVWTENPGGTVVSLRKVDG